MALVLCGTVFNHTWMTRRSAKNPEFERQQIGVMVSGISSQVTVNIEIFDFWMSNI